MAALVAACDEGSFPDTDGGGNYGDSYLPNYFDAGGVARPQCTGKETTITGTVYAPNGTDPVPGATVFIPATVPEMFPPEVRCEVCGHLGSSNNLWYDTTTADGKFTLSAVCPGKWPVVFQNGRFRRLIYVDVQASTPVALTMSQTRLPKKNAEFTQYDAIPKIAVATGDFDKMECVLRKIGLADGTYDLYEDAASLKSPKTLPNFNTLVNNLSQMKKYNIIFINCTANTFESELTKPAVRQNIASYIKAGGRLYVTDWSYDWIEQVESFASYIDFEPGASGGTPETQNKAALGADGLKVSASIKDSLLASWLANFPGAISAGHSTIEHFLINWVMMFQLNKDVKLWVEGQVSSQDGSIKGVKPLTVTFNFDNCGKILYTSYHTEGRDNEILPLAFPQYCGSATSLSPQDRILEFLIFDIANCIKPIE